MKTARDTSATNARGRGRGRGGRAERGKDSAPGSRQPRNTVVSSSGLFSEGAGDSNKKLFRSFRGGDESSSASALRRPTISKKREKIDPQLEMKQMAEIYDLDIDETDEPTGASTSEIFSPIILSQSKFQMNCSVVLLIVNCARNLFAVKPEVKLEERINGMEIKEENTEMPDDRLKYPNNIGEFFERTSPQLFLMQVKQMPNGMK